MGKSGSDYFKRRNYADFFIFSTIIICIITLAGWIFNIHELTNFNFSYAWMHMMPITALLISECALTLWLIKKGISKKITIVLSFVLISSGLFAIINSLTLRDLSLKNVLHPKLDPFNIAPLTAIEFVCLGTALLLLSFNKKKFQIVIEIFAIIVLLSSSIIFIGYTYGISSFQNMIDFFTMPFQASICFILLSIFVLVISKHKILLQIFFEDYEFSKVARKYLISISFIILIIGFLLIQGQRAGYYGIEVGLGIMILTSIILGFFIVRIGLVELKKKELEKNKVLIKKIETETNFKTTLDRIAQGFITLNKEFQITYSNKTVFDFTDKSFDQLFLKNIWNEFPEAIGTTFQKDCIEANIKQIYVNQKSYYSPLKKWFDYDIYPSQNGLSIFFRDITERKDFENHLKTANERFNLISKATNEALWESNLETGELWANELHQDLFGLTINDPIPSEEEWIARIHPEDRTKITEWHYKNFTSSENIFSSEYRFLSKNKTYIHIYDRAYFLRNRAGKPLRIMGSMMDITNLKKIEQQLEANEKHLQAILDTAPQCIKILNKNGELLEMNKKGLEILGVNKLEEIINKPIIDIIDEPYKDDYLKIIKSVFGGESVLHQFEINSYNGKKIWLESHSVPLKDKAGNIVALLSVTNDISSRKKVEIELQESYNSVRKLTKHLQNIREEERTFLSRELHDELGQQLAAMKMDLGWVNKRLKEAEEPVREKTNAVMEQISLLIRSVRKISFDLRPSTLSDFGIAAAMEQYLKDFEERSEIKISFNRPTLNPELNDTVKTALFRIFQESITNISRHAQAQNIFIELNFFDEKIILVIQDDGIGFNEEILKTNKTLGIIGMKERVVILDGEFEIVSEPNKGTTIKVEIPYLEN